jgi:hypothetical protein
MSHAGLAANASPRPSASANSVIATRQSGSIAASGETDGGLMLANLGRIIDRLEETLEQETQLLLSRKPFDLKEFNNRKSHGLLELTRAARSVESANLAEPMRVRLSQLRAKLEANRAVLAMHVEAVREIAAIMADAISEAESDGTYSASIAKRGTGP